MMEVEVICDDGYQAKLMVSSITKASQVIEHLNGLRNPSINSNGNKLNPVLAIKVNANNDELIYITSDVSIKNLYDHYKLKFGPIQLHAIGYKEFFNRHRVNDDLVLNDLKKFAFQLNSMSKSFVSAIDQYSGAKLGSPSGHFRIDNNDSVNCGNPIEEISQRIQAYSQDILKSFDQVLQNGMSSGVNNELGRQLEQSKDAFTSGNYLKALHVLQFPSLMYQEDIGSNNNQYHRIENQTASSNTSSSSSSSSPPTNKSSQSNNKKRIISSNQAEVGTRIESALGKRKATDHTSTKETNDGIDGSDDEEQPSNKRTRKASQPVTSNYSLRKKLSTTEDRASQQSNIEELDDFPSKNNNTAINTNLSMTQCSPSSPDILSLDEDEIKAISSNKAFKLHPSSVTTAAMKKVDMSMIGALNGHHLMSEIRGEMNISPIAVTSLHPTNLSFSQAKPSDDVSDDSDSDDSTSSSSSSSSSGISSPLIRSPLVTEPTMNVSVMDTSSMSITLPFTQRDNDSSSDDSDSDSDSDSSAESDSDESEVKITSLTATNKTTTITTSTAAGSAEVKKTVTQMTTTAITTGITDNDSDSDSSDSDSSDSDSDSSDSEDEKDNNKEGKKVVSEVQDQNKDNQPTTTNATPTVVDETVMDVDDYDIDHLQPLTKPPTTALETQLLTEEILKAHTQSKADSQAESNDNNNSKDKDNGNDSDSDLESNSSTSTSNSSSSMHSKDLMQLTQVSVSYPMDQDQPSSSSIQLGSRTPAALKSLLANALPTKSPSHFLPRYQLRPEITANIDENNIYTQDSSDSDSDSDSSSAISVDSSDNDESINKTKPVLTTITNTHAKSDTIIAIHSDDSDDDKPSEINFSGRVTAAKKSNFNGNTTTTTTNNNNNNNNNNTALSTTNIEVLPAVTPAKPPKVPLSQTTKKSNNSNASNKSSNDRRKSTGSADANSAAGKKTPATKKLSLKEAIATTSVASTTGNSNSSNNGSSNDDSYFTAEETASTTTNQTTGSTVKPTPIRKSQGAVGATPKKTPATKNTSDTKSNTSNTSSATNGKGTPATVPRKRATPAPKKTPSTTNTNTTNNNN